MQLVVLCLPGQKQNISQIGRANFVTTLDLSYLSFYHFQNNCRTTQIQKLDVC